MPVGRRLEALVWAARPWSFTMTLVSAAVGSLLGARAGSFSWGLFLAALGGLVLAHSATNTINDYFDTRYGVDSKESPTARYRRHPLLTGALSPRALLAAALIQYGLAIGLGVLLTAARGWPVLALTAVGAALSVLYSGGPLRYKPRGLGEVAVFLCWGPLMVGGCAFIQAGTWEATLPALVVSVPQGLWVALVIFANNMKDTGYDERTGVRTLANRLGRSRSGMLFVAALAAVYAATATEVLAGALSGWAWLVLLSLPVSVRLAARLRGAGEVAVDADPATAKAAMVYGALLVAALLVDRMGWLA